MHRISTRGREELVTRGIRTVVDLRMTPETEGSPNVFARSNDVRYIHVNLMGEEWMDTTSVAQSMESTDKMLLLYGVILDQRRDYIREVLDILSRPDHRPALFHCSAGKDRTGIISALLLGLAGATAETIAGDYALSARYLVDRYREADTGDEGRSCTWEDVQREWCPPDRILHTMAYLEREFGGIEPYVRTTGLRSDQVASLRSALVGADP